jgi:tripartite-type tricarboxylate transporter receptor subunit TctC
VSAEVIRILGMQDVKDRLLAVGAIAVPGTSEQFAERIRADVAKWGKVARTANVRIE